MKAILLGMLFFFYTVSNVFAMKVSSKIPKDNEIKVEVIHIGNGFVTAEVKSSKSKKIKAATIKIKVSAKKGQTIIFTPGNYQKGIWTAKKGSTVQIGK